MSEGEGEEERERERGSASVRTAWDQSWWPWPVRSPETPLLVHPNIAKVRSGVAAARLGVDESPGDSANGRRRRVSAADQAKLSVIKCQIDVN